MAYEIEIKSLLGSPDEAERVRQQMAALDPQTRQTGRNSQLNHYFHGGDIHVLHQKVADLFGPAQQEQLNRIVTDGRDHSVRTRKQDDAVRLVVKASIDDTTSENGISRMEFEEPVNMTLDALDQLILDAGYAYQAKWSRDREEYDCKGVHICLDRNAGYGFLAEFEKVVEREDEAEAARQELYTLMNELGVQELPQDRLQRMFEYYNQHWPVYYGTDKIFTVE